ncbi:Uncharacterised protein [Mycobacteroides abscessus subsp. abscessus]|nr:Uncharacterised protein [Mycobacteroides abscessus subsp. abscessus]
MAGPMPPAQANQRAAAASDTMGSRMTAMATDATVTVPINP